MINILHIVGGARYGGISAVVLNYYSHIDRTKIHFDLAVTDKYIGRHANILESMGCRIYPVCLKSENPRLYIRQIEEILRNTHYDAIHVHGSDTSWFTLRIAKRIGVKMRIAHAHTAGHLGPDNLKFKVKNKICQTLNRYYSTHLISCGRKAGDFIYGRAGVNSKKHMVLPNAIDVLKFSFRPEIREKMRSNLGLDNVFVVGMIGRIAPPKNTVHAISLFRAIKSKIPQAKLLMVGDGPDIDITKEEIKKLGLEDDVIFLGQRKDVSDIYQALDLYMLPSQFEGFPVAAVEAMATGLPCLLSDTITNELNFGENVHYLPLDNIDEWGEVASLYFPSRLHRELGAEEIKRNGLDIGQTSCQLANLYLGKI